MADPGWLAGRDTGDEQAEQPGSCRCSHPVFWHDAHGGPCQRISCGCRQYRPRTAAIEHDERLYAMAHTLAGNHEQRRAEAELTAGRQTNPTTTLDPSTP